MSGPVTRSLACETFMIATLSSPFALEHPRSSARLNTPLADGNRSPARWWRGRLPPVRGTRSSAAGRSTARVHTARQYRPPFLPHAAAGERRESVEGLGGDFGHDGPALPCTVREPLACRERVAAVPARRVECRREAGRDGETHPPLPVSSATTRGCPSSTSSSRPAGRLRSEGTPARRAPPRPRSRRTEGSRGRRSRNRSPGSSRCRPLP